MEDWTEAKVSGMGKIRDACVIQYKFKRFTSSENIEEVINGRGAFGPEPSRRKRMNVGIGTVSHQGHFQQKASLGEVRVGTALLNQWTEGGNHSPEKGEVMLNRRPH